MKADQIQQDRAGRYQGEWRGTITFLAGGLFLTNLLLLAPGWVASGGIEGPWVAVESFILMAIFLLLPRGRLAKVLATLAALLVMIVLLLGLADVAARQSLARPLNLYLDLALAAPVANLLVGNLGGFRAGLVGVLGVIGFVGWAALLAVILSRLPRVEPDPGPRVGAPSPEVNWQRPALALAVLALPIVLWATAGPEASAEAADAPDDVVAKGLPDWAAMPAVALFREQREILGRMLGEREVFAGEMAATPSSYAELPGILEGLGGREVILAFVESYGVSALDDPLYRPVVAPRLDDMEERLGAAGFHLASGRLEAPSQGGQSWFGRGAIQSGIWLDNQLRYDLLLASSRETLVDDFRAAGYATAAVMPAITMAWPEGERFGYDRIFAHRDMEYGGPPINWVTKPDEYTWCFFERVVRPLGADRPLFTEIALISSHAPWVPILPVLGDCGEVGDGSVFARWMEGSERPEDLWRDTDRVREHYAMAVEYSLHSTLVFAERDLGPDALLIVMGDHQAAPLITGEDASRSVPVHVISGRPDLVEPFLDWGFVPGAHPPPEEARSAEADPRMDHFRHWFVPAFSRTNPDPP